MRTACVPPVARSNENGGADRKHIVAQQGWKMEMCIIITPDGIKKSKKKNTTLQKMLMKKVHEQQQNTLCYFIFFFYLKFEVYS